jgi:glutamate synthase (NADPH/NADH) small chain
MELSVPDASGRKSVNKIEGSEFCMDVDTVIVAIGQSPNPLIRSTTPDLETNSRGCIVVKEETGETSKQGVYAGGDAVTGAATVILAMGAGKTAAQAIDEYLADEKTEKE